MRKFSVSVLEVLEVVGIALVAVFLIRKFLVQPFLVSGASMVPTFANGDYVLVDELSYYFRAPQRGEVIVFRYPNDESTYFIKRVIGLPGEHVTIRDGKVSALSADAQAGKTLAESYLPAGTITSPHQGGRTEFVLGAHQYFVLGDNRSYSFDSRDWGFVDSKEIMGAVRLRLWPIQGATVFAAPQYGV